MLILRKVKTWFFFFFLVLNNNRKNKISNWGEEGWGDTLTTSFQHWFPERKWKNPNLNQNLQRLWNPCTGPYWLVLQGGEASTTHEPSFLLQTPFLGSIPFLFPWFYFTLWSACNIVVWRSHRERGGNMQGEFLQMSGRVVPGQLGLEASPQGGSLVWRGRMWAQPHLVSFNAHSKSPELLHSFSMSYIKSDY